MLFDEAELARACAEAAAAACLAERRAAVSAHEAQIAAALAAIGRSLDRIDALLAERQHRFRAAAATLAKVAVEALAVPGGPAQVARLAEALAVDCLARLDPELDLTVEVEPQLADALAAKLDASPLVRHRAGRLAVEAAAGIAPGAVRLVWPDGSADWSIDRIGAAAAALLLEIAEPAPCDSERPGGWPLPEAEPGDRTTATVGDTMPIIEAAGQTASDATAMESDQT
jgi:hypothetical protein